MKKIIAILLAVLCVLPAFAFTSVTAKPNEWQPLWLTHYNDSANEAAAVIITKDEFNVINAWAWRLVFIFSPVEGKPGVYELTDKFDHLNVGADSETVITAFTGSSVPDGGFIYNINHGNDYSSTGGIDYTNDNTVNAIEDAKNWEVGTRFEFTNLNLESLVAPTLTPNLKWYESGYVCTAKYRIYVEESRPATESISIDGVHNDNAWNDSSWITANGESGYWQKNFSDKSLSFKYQFRTDVNYLYGAAEIFTTPVAGSGNGSATNFRLWLNTDPASTVATHYYDVYYSKNGGAGITPSNGSTAMIAALTTTSNSVKIEFRLPLSEINATDLEQIPYFISCSTNNGSEEPCLYFPKVYWNSSSVFSPKNSWYRANDGDLDALALRLNGLEYTLSEDGSYYILSGVGGNDVTDVVVPDNYAGLPVKEIGRLAFSESSVKSVVLGSNVTLVGYGAFSQCKSLTTVTLGKNTEEIGMMAFIGCSALSQINITGSLKTIGNAAFSSCGLTSIEIPASVEKIGSNAFAFCASLENIYCGASTQPENWSELWNSNCDASVVWSGITHSIDTSKWETDDDYHWHKCTHCDEYVADYGPHIPDVNGICTACSHQGTVPPVDPDPNPDTSPGRFSLDLTDFFPFCIPFDLYDMLKAFVRR